MEAASGGECGPFLHLLLAAIELSLQLSHGGSHCLMLLLCKGTCLWNVVQSQVFLAAVVGWLRNQLELIPFPQTTPFGRRTLFALEYSLGLT